MVGMVREKSDGQKQETKSYIEVQNTYPKLI